MPTKRTKARNLLSANTDGWTSHTLYHFSKVEPFDQYFIRCDWYPSTKIWNITSPIEEHNNVYKQILPATYHELFYGTSQPYRESTTGRNRKSVRRTDQR